MATFDANAWYAISETRVDNGSSPLKNTLQTRPEGMRVFALVDQAWQMQPVDNTPGRYLMRTSTSGPTQQLTTCFNADETHPGRTRTCLRRSVSDDTQKWLITPWGNNTFKIQNLANGTGYALDVHPGADPFMSSEIEGEGSFVNVKQVAQHWVFSSRRKVDDGAYSTIYSETPTSTATTPTSTGTNVPASTGGNSNESPSPSNPPASTSLSAGAAAGIGVGVTVGAIAIIGALVFFWWRRRRAAKGAPLPSPAVPMDGYNNMGGAYGGHQQKALEQQQHQQQQQQQQQAQWGGAQYPMDPTKQHSPYSNSNAYSPSPNTVVEAPTPTTHYVQPGQVHEAPVPEPPVELDANYRPTQHRI